MESQPQNPEFRNNPENFHPCIWTFFHKYLGFCLVEVENPGNCRASGQIQFEVETRDDDSNPMLLTSVDDTQSQENFLNVHAATTL